MSQINWSEIVEEAVGGFTLAKLPPTLELPALPYAVTRFVEKSKDPNVAIRDLSTIIETDTGLTVELLRYVNSAFVGVRHKATSVQMGISLLGLRQSKQFLIQTGMQAAILARKSKLIHQGCFWNASLQKALFAKEVAKLLKTDEDLAFSGGLLQDYLLPVLTNELFEPYMRFVEKRGDFSECICAFEQSNFNWDHALAGACLARRWNLPDELVCCILFHHQGLRILTHPVLGRSPVAAVAISALIPDQLRQHYNGLEQLLALEQKWPAFRLQELAEIVDDKHATLGTGVQNDFPLSRRCKAVLEQRQFNDGTLKAVAFS